MRASVYVLDVVCRMDEGDRHKSVVFDDGGMDDQARGSSPPVVLALVTNLAKPEWRRGNLDRPTEAEG